MRQDREGRQSGTKPDPVQGDLCIARKGGRKVNVS